MSSSSCPVWLFSSGPVGDPPKPLENPAEVADVVKRLGARGHRLFAGRIEGSDLGISEKALVALVRAPDGDFRPWSEIATWAESIASQLQEAAAAMTMTCDAGHGRAGGRGHASRRARRIGATVPPTRSSASSSATCARWPSASGPTTQLAEQLWASGNADARLLACMVADPADVSEDELDAWLDRYRHLLPGRHLRGRDRLEDARPPGASRALDRLRPRPHRTGRLGPHEPRGPQRDEAVPDDYLRGASSTLIAERIEGYGNWTRRSASNTITGIGLRNDALEAAARETAAAMGPVEFDPGQTSCVMPDPIEYLEKTKAYRARQAAEASGQGQRQSR